MPAVFKCRRSVIALFSICCLTVLGLYHGQDISGIAIAIAGVAGSIAGSNAWENRARHGSGASSSESTKSVKVKVDSPD